MSKIKKLLAREILNSRGNPTVEVELFLDSVSSIASVPSGISTGKYEALELVDGDISRFGGLGVLKAIDNINTEIFSALAEKDFNQSQLDNFLIELDGTVNKSRLGANAILAVSLAFARACAKEKNIELYEYIGELGSNKDFKLPQPMLNVINGGKHADSGLEIQEFILAPIGFPNFHKKIEVGEEIIVCLKKLLLDGGYSVSVGDEGGFAPKLSTNEEAFDFLVKAISLAGHSTDDVKIGVDIASSTFYKNEVYELKNKTKNTTEMIVWYEELIKKYPIIFIEDGLNQDDFDGFALMTEKLGKKIAVVGDDLLVTNIERIKTAIEKKSVNSVLIKLNQIGTLTETVEAVTLTKKQGWIPFVSHRSGETSDTFIADLAVGLSCQYIKAGSLSRGERVCKYNRLMEIEDKLQNR